VHVRALKRNKMEGTKEGTNVERWRRRKRRKLKGKKRSKRLRISM
jgi:hypothetical protein